MAHQQHHLLVRCLSLILLDCPGARVTWVTLTDDIDFTTTEINLGNVLSVSSTLESHAGSYTCTSRCKQSSKRATATLNVFSFPDPVLSMAPLNPVSGQPVQVNCTVTAVYCSLEYKVDIKLFREDELSGPMYELCDESIFCDHTLSATDRTGGKRVNYRCLAEFTDFIHTINKTANATLHFQDTGVVESKQDTSPTLASLTSRAATTMAPITDTSPVESAITREPNRPDGTPVSSKEQATSSQPITKSSQLEGSTTQTQDSRESNMEKATEEVSKFTTSIVGASATLLLSIVGIVAYLYKYGRKLPPCLRRSQRKENTDKLKEVL
ncbi:vascular cell adhesion protein 1-like isoform X2 [Clupea harengus]|uniref:Vascular cell adhesion protein 1-like isoform X2 n=1 Tax=Clupea harengus TaxID=7950 RepID=A0A6P8G507_CLUHA|nr:vascular cell adhesion protein 1-like isoform X2 [Clupea harengus]